MSVTTPTSPSISSTTSLPTTSTLPSTTSSPTTATSSISSTQHDQYIHLFNDFKDTISRAPQTIDNYFGNMEIEIDVRIDSIVEQLQKSNKDTKEIESIIEEYEKTKICLFQRVSWYKMFIIDYYSNSIESQYNRKFKDIITLTDKDIKEMKRLKQKFSALFDKVKFIPTESEVVLAEVLNLNKMIGKFEGTDLWVFDTFIRYTSCFSEVRKFMHAYYDLI